MHRRSILKTIYLLVALLMLPLTAEAHPYHFKEIDARFDNLAKRLNDIDFDNQREKVTETQLAELDRIAAHCGNKQLQARALYWRVRSGQMSAQTQKCVDLLDKAMKLCADDYEYDKACINYQMAGNQERLGHYLQAYNQLNAALPVFEREGDHYFQGNAFLLLAQLFSDINDPTNTKEALLHAKEAYTKVGYPLNRIYFFEAMLSSDKDKLNLYKRSLDTGGQRDWGMTVQAMTNICQLFLNQQRLDSAEVYCDMASQLLDRQAPANQLFRTLVNIEKVRVLYAKGDYPAALQLLKSEEAKSEWLRGERFLTDIYEYLWRTSEKLGNQAEAHRYLQLYMKEYKRNEEEIRRQDIPKARAREAIARRNDTISLLEKDAQLSRTVMYIVVLVSIVLVLIAAALFIYFYQQYKIRKIENRELRNNLRQEALIYSINRKNFEEDIKQKDCEISSSTLLLANKNEVLNQISNIANRYLEEGKVPVEFVKQVNEVIGSSLKNDDEWERFKLHFDSVHPDFFVKLKAASSELTENDLRLCAYIRIGMRAKQIAEMLSVSSDSINSNRYRLRKKLGLQRGESLDDFIRKV